MRFLLITSLRKDIVKVWVCQETSPAGSLLPPVDLASIASVIRQIGHEVKIIDLRLFKKPLEKYLRELTEFKPDSVVFNLSTTSANYDYEIIAATPSRVKKICFGTHAQSLPEECFQKGVDYILIGDPEAALFELLKNNIDGRNSNGVLTVDIQKKAPYYWKDLDSMPFPSLDLLDLSKYHAPYISRGNLFTLLLGSRGCPYSCTYCLYPVLFGDKFRLRSVRNIVDEIKDDYIRYEVREFYFLDATFNINEKRVEDFCTELLKRNLNISWSCNMRVSPISSDILHLMKISGCNRVFYGVEDQDFLKETQKGTTREMTIEAFRKTKEVGIPTVAFMMIFPREDIDNKRYESNIFSVLKMLHADAFQCNIAIPFPGTKLFKDLEEKDKLLKNWSLFDPHGMELPFESPLNLINIKKSIYKKFIIKNPASIIKLLFNINFKSLKSLIFVYFRLYFLRDKKKCKIKLNS